MDDVPTPTDEKVNVHIPECCTSGDPDCKHVVNKTLKDRKTNPAL